MARTENWRVKYLQALEEQEQQERQSAQQLQLLQRALSRVSVVASGQDDELDDVLTAIRGLLQRENIAGLEAGLRDLEATIVGFEQRNQQRSGQMGAALSAAVEMLQGQPGAKILKKPLKKYAAKLGKCAQQPQQYPQLLRELTELQAQVLAQVAAEPGATAAKSSSLWDKFLGRDEAKAIASSQLAAEKLQQQAAAKEQQLETETGVETEADVEAPSAQPSGDDDRSAGIADSDRGDGVEGDSEVKAEQAIEGEWLTAESGSDQAEVSESGVPANQDDGEEGPEAVFQRPTHEPAFSKISDHITGVLNDLLDHLEPTECVQQKVENARERIERGLNWYELVPTLEDVRDLVMQAYLSADREFASYLDAVNGELSQIYQVLEGSLAQDQLVRDAGSDLQASVQNQVSAMEQSLAEATELDQLKSQVSSQIGCIQEALQSFSVATEPQQSLGDELQSLAARIQAMESEAQQSKASLEEQRHKAVTDSLTELPNREAYSERVYDELQRWQRYGRPLSLAVCDIDFFKRVNDNYGHQAGDRVLKVIAKSVAKRLREVDFMARYGGEEFVILLPETAGDVALQTLDKIRAAIARAAFNFKGEPVQITLSMGVSEFGEGDNAETVFERADKALYEAKEGGRNQCRLG